MSDVDPADEEAANRLMGLFPLTQERTDGWTPKMIIEDAAVRLLSASSALQLAEKSKEVLREENRTLRAELEAAKHELELWREEHDPEPEPEPDLDPDAG